MPRKQVDYSRTVIYKIVNYDIPELIYIGSTTDFTKRKNHHKYNCNNEKSRGYNLKVYNTIRENGGWENWTMIILHSFPCKNQRESAIEEDRCMTELKANLQMIKAHQSKEGRVAYEMEYYINNKETILKKHKEYRHANKEFVSELSKKYRHANKESISEKAKQKCTCDCGACIRKSEKPRHEKSIKHQKYIESCESI